MVVTGCQENKSRSKILTGLLQVTYLQASFKLHTYRPLTSYILTGLSVGHFMEERSSLKAGGEGRGDWRRGGGDWQVSLF